MRMMPRQSRPPVTILAAGLVAAAWTFAVPAASAQDQPPAGSSEKSSNISDEKLDKTAAALELVVAIRENYQQRITAAEPSDRQRLADEGNNALEKAVTDQGISVEEYSSILRVAQNDPDIRQKILSRLPSADK